MEDVNECLKQAWSYENRAAHGSTSDTQFVGTTIRGKRIYDVHKDEEGRYWYTVRIVTENSIKPEYEAIFGHRGPIHAMRGIL